MSPRRRAVLPIFLLCICCAVACSNADAEWTRLRDAGNLAYRDGDYAGAVEHWSAALKLAEKFGEADDRYTVSLTSRASLHKVLGEYAEAERLLLECVRIEDLLDTPPGASLGEYLLATLYVDLARYDDAEPLLERVLAFHGMSLDGANPLQHAVVVEKYPDPVVVPPEPLFAVGCLHRLGQMRIEQARYAEADHLLARAEQLARQVGRPQHVAVIVRRRADLAMELGKYDEALRLAQAALAMEGGAESDHHLAVPGASLAQAGFALHALGRDVEAERSLREARATQQRILGADHAVVGSTVRALAEVRLARGDTDEAERLARRAGRIHDRHLPPQHPDVARSRLTLARVLAAKDECHEARVHADHAIGIFTGLFSPAHPAITAAEAVMGDCADPAESSTNPATGSEREIIHEEHEGPRRE